VALTGQSFCGNLSLHPEEFVLFVVFWAVVEVLKRDVAKRKVLRRKDCGAMIELVCVDNLMLEAMLMLAVCVQRAHQVVLHVLRPTTPWLQFTCIVSPN
jgi:hypothetical protein